MVQYTHVAVVLLLCCYDALQVSGMLQVPASHLYVSDKIDTKSPLLSSHSMREGQVSVMDGKAQLSILLP